MEPMDRQVGGDHYKRLAIQPLEYCMKNGLGICEHAIIKYISRWKVKHENGIDDLLKAQHYLEILIEDARNER
jgi:hypothetical protein